MHHKPILSQKIPRKKPVKDEKWKIMCANKQSILYMRNISTHNGKVVHTCSSALQVHKSENLFILYSTFVDDDDDGRS